jgi:hypothetical protein
MEEGKLHTYFVWATIPYGYTRAPYIAKSLMKPLVVFYDDGMAVADSEQILKKQALQIQCDLLREGFSTGSDKVYLAAHRLYTMEWFSFRFQKEMNFDYGS